MGVNIAVVVREEGYVESPAPVLRIKREPPLKLDSEDRAAINMDS